ncbi:MAG: SURF1 family protein, partial [Methylophilaceae bacterium]
MTLAMLVTVAVCIKLGSWQYHKAQSKQALQQQLEMGLLASPVALPPVIDDIEKWRYRRVKFSGEFAPQYQVLLDNQVDNTVVGYHVLTPVKLEEANQYVLVNRGWVAGNLNRQLPAIKTPIGRQEFVGDIFNPLA